MGVGAIKVDFGEAAPFNGIYASGRSGFYEHNLYPLRYNKAVADVTREVQRDENLIWARSAWAGSQRYPLHWGGDSRTPITAMASTLRAGSRSASPASPSGATTSAASWQAPPRISTAAGCRSGC